MHFPFRPGSRRRELAEVNRRLEAVRAEIAELEAMLAALPDEQTISQSDRVVEQLRSKIIRDDLARKQEELETLGARARALGADLEAHPSGAYPALELPGEPPPPEPPPAAGVPSLPNGPAPPITEPTVPPVILTPPSQPEPSAAAEPPPAAAQPRTEAAATVEAPAAAPEPVPVVEAPAVEPVVEAAAASAATLPPAGELAAVAAPATEAATSPGEPVRGVEPPKRRRGLALAAGIGLMVIGIGIAVGGIVAGRELGRPPAPSPTAPAIAAVLTAATTGAPAVVAPSPTRPPTPLPTSTAIPPSPTAVPVVAPPTETEAPAAAPPIGLAAPPALAAEAETVAAPEPEPTASLVALRSPAPAVVPRGTIFAPGYTGVYLRRLPSISAPTIRLVPVGSTVELLNGRAAADGLAWQQVRTTAGEIGWVSAGTIAR